MIVAIAASASAIEVQPDWQLLPSGISFGHQVEAADFDGDGHVNLALASVFYDDGFTDQGAILVAGGQGGGAVAAPSPVATGGASFLYFGEWADSSDLDGDGYADLVVGAYPWTNPESFEGVVRAFHGGPGGLNPVPAWTWEGNQANALYGQWLRFVGDLNADGYPELAVGRQAPVANPSIDLWFGGPAGLPAAPTATLFGYQATAVDHAGDLNGDGYGDLVVGDMTFGGVLGGTAVVWYGGPMPPSGPPDVVLPCIGQNTYFGKWVEGLGDIDGDGWPEIGVGAYTGSPSYAWIYRGGPDGLETEPAWGVHGEAGPFQSSFGQVLAGADLDADGWSDLVVAEPDGTVDGENAGRIHVFRGGVCGLAEVASWTGVVPVDNTELGWDLEIADIDGDGDDDVLAASRFFPGPGGDGGVFGFTDPCGSRDDADTDTVPDGCDVCPGGDDTRDEDGDGIPDDCDVCPLGPDCPDSDGDGHPDACDPCPDLAYETDADLDSVWSCDDCHDGDASVHPDAPELADGVDDDCDGIVDEGTEWYDDDGDGATEAGGDCADDDPTLAPGLPEVCNGRDDDCDAGVDENTPCSDDDGDGWSEDEGDCADADPAVYPGAPDVVGDDVASACVADAPSDPDGDGRTHDDCAPLDPWVFPGNEEVANGVDDDCDGAVDEATAAGDDDGDGFSEIGGDCHDGDPAIHPGADEVPDGLDNDCDGAIDPVEPIVDVPPDDPPDADGDGSTPAQGDCDDTTGWVRPGLGEVCDGLDNDCNGAIDDACAGAGDDPAPTREPGGCAHTGAPVSWLLAVPFLVRRTRRNPRRL